MYCSTFPHYTLQFENKGNSLSLFLDKNFVNATVLLNELLNSRFHEIFLGERIFSALLCTQCGKT